ncbi:hypothetical protein AMAG_19553 [Allomyces macrogynus ATCC 38327]|uniref:Uncharacterized protein n=1 Tax=Allomyces macrogynus (strain ATCC 38327) TaxID=578462 RepID=A0A0L0SWW9_ALLM3|nr:hypothetical protein AMAG_19553 [Allomyces macrogynus ATCC 38327]|eukprot:KNE66961.1 hypothetical protein AMAG_19553 [Allomyces macrogynus ATCC 38327]
MPATPHLRAHAVPSPPPLRVRRGLRRSETSGSMCSETSSIPDGRRSRAGMLAAARVMSAGSNSISTSATSSSASLSISLPGLAQVPAAVPAEGMGIAEQWIAAWAGLPAAHVRRERFRLLGCRPGAVGEEDEVGAHARHVLAIKCEVHVRGGMATAAGGLV